MKKNRFGAVPRAAACALVLGLAACGGGGGGGGSSPGATAPPTSPGASSPGPTVTAPTGKIIDNEDMTAGIKGVDADKNGIRDDIDRLIAQKYSATPAMKKAAEQEAKVLQRVLEASTKVQARIVGNEIMRAGDCTYKVFPRATSGDIKFQEQMSKEIEALTANTKERFTAYWNGNALMGGMVFSQAQEPVCD